MMSLNQGSATSDCPCLSSLESGTSGWKHGGHKRKCCKVQGCTTNLLNEGRSYCIKKGVCYKHMKAAAVSVSNAGPGLWRFCQQCGRLEPLQNFEGLKRSCHSSLIRRKVQAAARTALAQPHTQDLQMAQAHQNYDAQVTLDASAAADAELVMNLATAQVCALQLHRSGASSCAAIIPDLAITAAADPAAVAVEAAQQTTARVAGTPSAAVAAEDEEQQLSELADAWCAALLSMPPEDTTAKAATLDVACTDDAQAAVVVPVQMQLPPNGTVQMQQQLQSQCPAAVGSTGAWAITSDVQDDDDDMTDAEVEYLIEQELQAAGLLPSVIPVASCQAGASQQRDLAPHAGAPSQHWTAHATAGATTAPAVIGSLQQAQLESLEPAAAVTAGAAVGNVTFQAPLPASELQFRLDILAAEFRELSAMLDQLQHLKQQTGLLRGGYVGQRPMVQLAAAQSGAFSSMTAWY